MANQNWAFKHNEILFDHLSHPPEDFDEEVVWNLTHCGIASTQKIDLLLVLAGIINVSPLGFSA